MWSTPATTALQQNTTRRRDSCSPAAIPVLVIPGSLFLCSSTSSSTSACRSEAAAPSAGSSSTVPMFMACTGAGMLGWGEVAPCSVTQGAMLAPERGPSPSFTTCQMKPKGRKGGEEPSAILLQNGEAARGSRIWLQCRTCSHQALHHLWRSLDLKEQDPRRWAQHPNSALSALPIWS